MPSTDAVQLRDSAQPGPQDIKAVAGPSDTLGLRNLAEMVEAAAGRYASQKAFTAVVANGMNGSLTFAQVDQLADAFAAYLREELKVPEGTRVAVQLPNGLAYPVVVFGTFKAGCMLVNTNPLSVPYTHLTLPTNRKVEDSGVVGVIKKKKYYET